MATQKKALRKEKLSREQQQDVLLFESIKYHLLADGFVELSKEALKNIYRSIGLVAPEVPRTKDIEDKVSFILERNRLIIQVNTGFNRNTNQFSKDGASSVVIADPVNKPFEKDRVFYRQYNQVLGLDYKIQLLVDYLLDELSYEKRPQTSSGEWAMLVEIAQDIFFWTDLDMNPIRDLFENATPGGFVWKDQQQRINYELSREANGIVGRRRKIKLPYEKK